MDVCLGAKSNSTRNASFTTLIITCRPGDRCREYCGIAYSVEDGEITELLRAERPDAIKRIWGDDFAIHLHTIDEYAQIPANIVWKYNLHAYPDPLQTLYRYSWPIAFRQTGTARKVVISRANKTSIRMPSENDLS